MIKSIAILLILVDIVISETRSTYNHVVINDTNVRSLGVLPNGFLVSASSDPTIKIWSPLDGKLQQTLTGHRTTVYRVIVLSNGDMVSASLDRTMKIWNMLDGTVEHTLTVPTQSVMDLAELPNGDLVSGLSGSGSLIIIWDVQTGALKKSIDKDKVFSNADVHSLAVQPNGDLVIALNEFNTSKGFLLIWNGTHINWDEKIGYDDSIDSIAALPNGKFAVARTYPNPRIEIWNIVNNKVVLERTLRGHTAWIYSLQVLQNSYLISASYDRTVRIWDTEDGSLKSTITPGHPDGIRTLATYSNGNFATGSLKNIIISIRIEE